MKKLLCLAIALLLPLTCAQADDGDALLNTSIANATIAAAQYVDVTAPFSGTLETFDLAPGDAVAEGDTLMALQTTGIYATEASTVGAVFAAVGDDAAAVSQRYGGIIGLEPSALLQIQASTSGAYSDADNRTLHLGETLYFRSSKSKREEGTGRVVAVSGKNYVVDILTGSFDLDESLTLYRKDNYASAECVGKGAVARRGDVLLSASGRVSAIHIKEGDSVRPGQLLMEVIGADAAPSASPTVLCPQSGVISSVQAAPGQQVWKGQVLCRIELTDALEAVADVDEMDLGNLKVGDTLSVTIDMDESRVITGTVTEISSLGVTKQNAAYFTVHVSIPAGSAPLGASASVYLPKK